MSIEIVNDLSQALVARDFSDGHKPSQGGPTKTSRAMAIIHLAAHDAYAKVTTAFPPRLPGLPDPSAGSPTDDAAGTKALLGAGVCAAEILYPDIEFEPIFTKVRSTLPVGDPLYVYGKDIAKAWLLNRANDASELPQEDRMFDKGVGRHRPDPFNPDQTALGRNWGKVRPFVLTSVVGDTPLGPPPKVDTQEYALAFDQVFENGSDSLAERDSNAQHLAAVGVFWGYDGSNKLGTPPRLYNQVVRKIGEFAAAAHPKRIRVLAAANAAMADAGIAAWYWKYQFDYWRPILGIREANAGWGPSSLGDANTLRSNKGDPFWRPLGAPRSNPFPGPVAGNKGSNFTPNFPAYPSGHSTFGTACFETVAKLLGKTPEQINVAFESDEFNGITTDNQGVVRPRLVQSFTLRKAIDENKLSRIYLGVHWIFDATGGEIVGKLIADKVAAEFP